MSEESRVVTTPITLLDGSEVWPWDLEPLGPNDRFWFYDGGERPWFRYCWEHGYSSNYKEPTPCPECA